jgi:hypothetical protein
MPVADEIISRDGYILAVTARTKGPYRIDNRLCLAFKQQPPMLL